MGMATGVSMCTAGGRREEEGLIVVLVLQIRLSGHVNLLRLQNQL